MDRYAETNLKRQKADRLSQAAGQGSWLRNGVDISRMASPAAVRPTPGSMRTSRKGHVCFFASDYLRRLLHRGSRGSSWRTSILHSSRTCMQAKAGLAGGYLGGLQVTGGLVSSGRAFRALRAFPG